MNICFIGFGNMAKAIARGLRSGEPNWRIFASSPSLQAGETEEGFIIHANNREYLEQANVIVLAVKPSKIISILKDVQDILPSDCLIISVAAGVNLASLENNSPAKQAIIRAMPNIACQEGVGATALIANKYVNKVQKKWAEQLFLCSGMINWSEEEKEIDAMTALSGSGLAYVFLFMEAMIDAGMQLGIAPAIAKDFTLQTVAGALSLIKGTKLEIKDVRKKVTSPAGTTAAAIQEMQQQGFEDIVSKAMKAAFLRARELGMEINEKQ